MARSKGVFRRLTASEQNQQNLTPRRRGRKPKRIQDQELKPEDIKPIQRPEHSWSQQQKIRVLMFFYQHRIPIPIPIPVEVPDSMVGSGVESFNQYRSPTQQEASEIFTYHSRQSAIGWKMKIRLRVDAAVVQYVLPELLQYVNGQN